jgi:hypothetical protein
MEAIGTLYHCTSRAKAELISATSQFWGNAAFAPEAAAKWEAKGDGDPVVLELLISWAHGESWGRDNRRYNEPVPVQVVRVLTIAEAQGADSATCGGYRSGTIDAMGIHDCVANSRRRVGPNPAAEYQVTCTCDWTSEWLVSEELAADAKSKHLRDVRIENGATSG